MTADAQIEAVQTLIALADREEAQRAARQLSGRLSVSDLLRAADGAQQLARALATAGRRESGDAEAPDAHDIRSLYS